MLSRKNLDCNARWMGAGKYVGLVMCDATIMTFRLGMSGRFILNGHMNEVDKKHIILILQFEGGTVYYVDYRKFSRINIVESDVFRNINKHSLMYSYESEWFENDFTVSKVTKKPKITEMLDEGTKTGIGNYLANESLGLADMNPFTPFDSHAEKMGVYLVARGIAVKSFRAGGNTFNGGYKRVNGQSGAYKTEFYGNEDIRKTNFRGRPIFTNFKI